MTHQVFSLVPILAEEEYYCACGKCYVTGTGRSIYYAQEQLSEITVMLYLLSLGLTFQMGMDILEVLRSHQINLAEEQEPQSLMLCWNGEKFELETFATDKAISFWEEGKAVIPLWLDRIYEKLDDKL